jgi:ribosomal protein S18 acetylase RimI-like enzyme
MTLEILRYESTYQTAVIDLWKKCNLTVPQNDPREDIQKKLTFQPDLFFIALLKSTVIGTIMAGYDGHRGWLNYLAVLPVYQKRGYGRQLVEKAVDELRKLGCLKVNLQVRRTNTSVITFYTHLGFKEEDRVNLGMRLT